MGMGMGAPARGGCGCGTIFVAVIVLIIVLALISFITDFAPNVGFVNITQHSGAQITETTRVRDPLPANAAIDTGPMYTDNLGWIRNSARIETGLRNFHRATGVRPHVYITGEINGNTAPTFQQVAEYTRALYDELFNDEAHLLLVFFEHGEWPNHITHFYAQPGNQARLVMDGEALTILGDFLEFYYGQDIDTEDFFSNSFNQAANRIMHRPPDNRPIWITIIIVGGAVLLVYMVFTWWKKKQEQKNREAEQTERILNQSLDTFGTPADDEAARLAKQYMDDDDLKGND